MSPLGAAVKVNVKLFATLRAYAPAAAKDGVFCLELDSGVRIQDVIARLGLPGHPWQPPWLSLVNGRQRGPDHRLEDGDTLSFFPPLAGG